LRRERIKNNSYSQKSVACVSGNGEGRKKTGAGTNKSMVTASGETLKDGERKREQKNRGFFERNGGEKKGKA